ncbi:MAG TPA: sigma-70 family RNA polymerase sigma factor [Candidatus Dormibacteraeota bacterium]|nr:sigma-70 family RNA polymerase sigma factor [Candidatus Dormibacteraeota bacterium]
MVEVAEDAAETRGPAAEPTPDHPVRPDDGTGGSDRGRSGRDEGSSRSFAEEAIGHLDTLYRGALRLTRDPAQAEDLVQDTYLRALRYQNSYQAGTNMKAWLFAIMRNLFWDRFRGGRPEDVSLDGDGEVSLYDTLRDQTAMPEAEVLDRIATDEVVRAVERLPELHREVVLLVDVEGFSYKDAAEVLGVPIGTVMSRLHRARRQLQKALYEYARESGIVHADRDR